MIQKSEVCTLMSQPLHSFPQRTDTMHFYFFMNTKYQQLKDMTLDCRVGNNNHNIIDRIMNNVINVEAASKFCSLT